MPIYKRKEDVFCARDTFLGGYFSVIDRYAFGGKERLAESQEYLERDSAGG
jgi:hypothetical protein